MQVSKITDYTFEKTAKAIKKELGKNQTSQIASQEKPLPKEICDAIKTRVRIVFPPNTPNEILSVKMNRLAVHNIRKGIDTSFSKASQGDLEILRNNEIRKYIYQNPESGKTYHLIHKETDSKGNVILRILNNEGMFLQEASIAPKTIAIIDDFSNKSHSISFLKHGEIVQKFLEAYNPCIKLLRYDGGSLGNPNIDNRKVNAALEDILKRINLGEKIDFLNCSFGIEKPLTLFEINTNKRIGLEKTNRIKVKSFGFYHDKIRHDNITSKGTRILCSAGNDGKDKFNLQTILFSSEGVGALNKEGDIADFSASRFYKGVQHYEQGIFDFIKRKNGVNITGTSGIDVKYPPELLRFMNSVPCLIKGTSYSSPIRTAKLALHESLKDLLD